MTHPSFSEFSALARQGNLIPIHQEVHFDWETPIGAFRKIDAGDYSFLLESVEGGEKWGRYSFLGSKPSHVFRSRGAQYEIVRNGAVVEKGETHDPLRALERFLARFRPAGHNALPRFFGGAVGHVNYDVIRSFERIPARLRRDPGIDDCCFMIADTLLVFDNLQHKIRVISNVFLDGSRSLEEAYREGEDKISEMIVRLRAPAPPNGRKNSFPPRPLQPNQTREDFMSRVETAKSYIQAGDVIQVVLSQRLSAELRCEPFDVYRALRSINPSPYLFYLKTGDHVLLGASPEVMVRLEGRQIELRPLAGTRRRGKTIEEDLAMEQELLSDEKERAEHIMLVDLGRNDVGRVAEIGTIEVTELMGIERYSHVMHIVSNIRGLLASGKNAFDVFRAAFPAGTVSGSPKIRAMEIIEELEPQRRGPYAGAVGYFNFAGDMDTCITIRSIAVRNGRAELQVGAGIVADSDPEREYEETLNKGQALFRAIRAAEEGLP
ncbi:MAG TPA: anthranilate synthase component I [Thermodesulfobacteriota bacterium]|nr:anthranilate synthase component I [Thermodesulfobacteriota bacterium]